MPLQSLTRNSANKQKISLKFNEIYIFKKTESLTIKFLV